MIWVFFIAVAVVLVGGFAALITGRMGYDPLAEATTTQREVALPEELHADDIADVHFDTAMRGYRMDQVDAVLDQLQRRIAELETGRPVEVSMTRVSMTGVPRPGVLRLRAPGAPRPRVRTAPSPRPEMGLLHLTRETAAEPAAVWAVLTDFAGYGRWMPLTRMRVDAGPPRLGWGFAGVSGWGPLAFSDSMLVSAWEPPIEGIPGRFRVVKTGRLLGGWAEVSLPPTADGCPRVDWL